MVMVVFKGMVVDNGHGMCVCALGCSEKSKSRDLYLTRSDYSAVEVV